MKNVIAIAAGVVEGLGLGHNALAALITRGLAEITRLACAAGGRRDTLAGLSGLGDLVLTCTGTLSRNRHVGVELARGRPLAEVVAGMKMVAKACSTTGAALALGERHGVELPIATQMAEVLSGRADVADGRRRADGAASRGPKSESVVKIAVDELLLGRIREGLSRTKQQIVDALRRHRPQRGRPGASFARDRRRYARRARGAPHLRRPRAACDHRIIADVKAQPRDGASLRDLVKQEIRRVFDAVDRPVVVDAPSEGRADRRRQRHRQDDDRRQAREPAEGRRDADR